MKKGVLYIIALIFCVGGFTSCLKNGTERTIDPSMTASLGAYTFNATYVQPATLKPQLNDSATTLIIRGIDKASGDGIDISITKYTGKQGTFSIVDGNASGFYYHNGVTYPATSGVVAIKEVGANAITGYFSFTTSTGAVTNGLYVVGKPWNY